jgi:hypothetical protein
MSALCVCDGCGQELDPFENGPMLHDHIWSQISNPGERFMCQMCMEERAADRMGRGLEFADLRPCEFNLSHRPDSWFDTFIQWEEGLPPNYAEWEAADRAVGLLAIERLFRLAR